MKRIGLFILTVISVGTWLAPVGGQQPAGNNYVAGEILVQFARGVSASRRQTVMAGRSSTIMRRFEEVELDHVRLPPGKSVEAALAELRGNPEILLAQPNFTYQTTAAPGPPNDPYWLNDLLWGMQKIGAAQAWQAFGAGNGSVIIADIDTGVMYTHPDLAANMWQNPGEIPGNSIDDDHNNYIDDIYGIDAYNHDSNPMDDNGHGTHTSGTIGAVGNNGVGVAGVNWNAKILACKFLNAAGNGSDAGAIECLNYITALKNRGENIRVSSNSWGSTRGGQISQALKNAFDAAGNAGILNVCAAGNAGANTDASPFDPASFTSASIVSVAASDSSDNKASFSNYGVTSVDLAAPGVGIYSSITGANPYVALNGTSMAAPHVAGVAALVASLAPSLSVDGLKATLLQNVDVLPQWASLVATGGRLNMFKAATAVAVPPSARTNVALAANGGSATASSVFGGGYPASAAINGDRRGQSWASGGGWMDGTSNAWPDWLEVSFSGAKTIDEIDVFSIQDAYSSPSEPTQSMTFSLFGLTNFRLEYWNGSAWVTVPGAVTTSNTLVWRQFVFSPLTTTKIRVWILDALFYSSRLAEVEAYTSTGTPNTPPAVALTGPANGATFVAPATIGLAGTATDSDGISSVSFLANGNPIGTDTTNPYSFSWTNVPAGTYVLTAFATDGLGGTNTSAPVTVTVSPAAGTPLNVAAASNGATALASSVYGAGYPASAVINGDRRGQGWASGGGWMDATSSVWPDWVEVDFAGAQTIGEIDVFSIQDAYTAPIDPTLTTTFSLFGLRDFEVQYWTGSTWATVPGTTVTNNTLVWRKFTFAPLTTSRIRVWVTNALFYSSRVAEVEAYGVAGGNLPPSVTLTGPANGASFTAPATINFTADASDSDGSVASVEFFANGLSVGSDTTSPYAFSWANVPAGTYVLTAVATDNLGTSSPSASATVTVNGAGGRTNVAAAASGATVTASSVYGAGYPAAAAINGDRRGQGWASGGGWMDGTSNVWPDWVEITFAGSRTIDEIDVFSIQDSYTAPSDPTPSMTFGLFGLRDFEVQYWTGAAWAPVPGGTVSGNSLVWRQFTFAPLTTTKIRIWITDALFYASRLAEVEAYSVPAPAPVVESCPAPTCQLVEHSVSTGSRHAWQRSDNPRIEIAFVGRKYPRVNP